MLRASEGKEALSIASRALPELVVLDLGLPDMDGLEVCSRLKSDALTRAIPVLILTARSSDLSRLLARRHRADEFLAKPIEDVERFHRLVAALLCKKSPERREPVRVGDWLILDRGNRSVAVNGRSQSLSGVLFELLLELASHPGQLLTRRHLLSQVWPRKVRDRHVDLAVSRLKRRLGLGEGTIECVRGEGFRLIGPPQEKPPA